MPLDRFSPWNALAAAAWLGMAVLILATTSAAAQDVDRHAGYYYPEDTTAEVYAARLPIDPQAGRRGRIAFVTALTQQLLQTPDPYAVALFAKGEDAEKLILLSLQSGKLDTLYRMRAFLAILTAWARTTPVLQNSEIAENLTFLDLLKLLGFTQITLSDGDTFAHRIDIR